MNPTALRHIIFSLHCLYTHLPTVRRAGRVLLHDSDIMGRILLLHQQGEIQSGRSTANNTNPHAAKAPALKG
jgi:hypothetical protein